MFYFITFHRLPNSKQIQIINNHSGIIWIQHPYCRPTLCTIWMHDRCAVYALCCVCTVCKYTAIEGAGSWTNIPSCPSFLRYVLCKQHGPWYKLLGRDFRPFPSLVLTEYPLQILSALGQCHVCTAAWWDEAHIKVQLMVQAQTNTLTLTLYIK